MEISTTDLLEKRLLRLESAMRKSSLANNALRFLVCLGLVAWAVFPMRGGSSKVASLRAESKPAIEQKPIPPDHEPSPPPPNRSPIGSRVQSKFLDTEQLALLSEKGTCLAWLHSWEEVPFLSINGKDERYRLWLTVDKDGEPRIVFFNKQGKEPIELTIARDGEPRLLLKRLVPPPVKPVGLQLPPARHSQ